MKNAQKELGRMITEGKSRPFQVVRWKLTTIWTSTEGIVPTEATLQTVIGDQLQHTAGDGVGPINALDIAMKKAVQVFFPEIEAIILTGYTVKAENTGSDAPVLCTAKFRCGKHFWTSIAEHVNQDNAAWEALLDGYHYGIMSMKEANKW